MPEHNTDLSGADAPQPARPDRAEVDRAVVEIRDFLTAEHEQDFFSTFRQRVIDRAQELPILALIGVPAFFSTLLPLLFRYSESLSLPVQPVFRAFVLVYLLTPILYIALRGLGAPLVFEVLIPLGFALVTLLTALAPHRSDNEVGTIIIGLSLAILVVVSLLVIATARRGDWLPERLQWLSDGTLRHDHIGERLRPSAQAGSQVGWRHGATLCFVLLIAVTTAGIFALLPLGNEEHPLARLDPIHEELIDTIDLDIDTLHVQAAELTREIYLARLDRSVLRDLDATRKTAWFQRIHSDGPEVYRELGATPWPTAADSILADSVRLLRDQITGTNDAVRAAQDGAVSPAAVSATAERLRLVEERAAALREARTRPIEARLQWLTAFEAALTTFREAAREDAQKRAAKIFQYVQKAGAALFLVSIVMLIGAWVFARPDPTAPGAAEQPDVHRGSAKLGIAVFTVLLLPLLYPIEPEDINVEDPYAMFTRANWFLPQFTERTINPRSESVTAYRDSRTVVQSPDTLPLNDQVENLQEQVNRLAELLTDTVPEPPIRPEELEEAVTRGVVTAIDNSERMAPLQQLPNIDQTVRRLDRSVQQMEDVFREIRQRLSTAGLEGRR